MNINDAHGNIYSTDILEQESEGLLGRIVLGEIVGEVG